MDICQLKPDILRNRSLSISGRILLSSPSSDNLICLEASVAYANTKKSAKVAERVHSTKQETIWQKNRIVFTHPRWQKMSSKVRVNHRKLRNLRPFTYYI